MGRRHVAFGVIEDQSPARSAFVVLPETRGKAVDELQPRRRFVALLGLWVNPDNPWWDYRALDPERCVPDPNFSTAGLENSCGKEGAVGVVKPGRKNREGGFLSYLPAGL